ncbi:kinetochore Sim4 complex subunit FTA2-domain-containing protein [Fusarium avenaceum]|nr:kinetochore Sim4 complex subunit FTA2-domain-containing protein [Fusarium avenaceum]
MPRRKRSQSTVLELPPCEGPKLNIFEHHKSKIQWLERLDDKDENVCSSEGYVFRARIRGREYAVKVFKFFDPMSTEYFWGPMLGEDTPLDTAAYYTDPFYAECRAYGRIRHAKEKGLKAVAVPCHGFLFLRPQEQQALEKQDIDLGLDEIDSDYQRSTLGGLKARAIVKDIASANTGVSSTSVRRILKRVVSMNMAGIYNMDIRIDNFRDGKLVDFGSSWTEPHVLLNSLNPEAALESKIADRVMFEQMVEEEEIETKHSNAGKEVKALHHMRLRSQKIS